MSGNPKHSEFCLAKPAMIVHGSWSWGWAAPLQNPAGDVAAPKTCCACAGASATARYR